MQIGLSQHSVAEACRISRSTYSRIENGRRLSASIVVAVRIGAVLGLDVVVRAYPGAEPIRDSVSARMISTLAARISTPLRHRTEVPLPRRGDRSESRRWDLVVFGHGRRTAFEFESRLYDVQAQRGRHNLKRHDDLVEQFVLVLADTGRNREVLSLYPDLFADLPRLQTATVLKALGVGQHPPTGLVLLRATATAVP